MPRLSALVAVTLLAVTPLVAQDHGAPPFTSDRPDFVKTAHTVGRGHWQIETSAASAWREIAGSTTRSFTTPTLLRIGIGERLELRAESEGYVRESADGVDAESGMADAALGLKWHARSGDHGGPAMALLLDAYVPTGSELFRGEGVRPQLRAVAEWELGERVGFGVMPGIVYNTDALGEREWSGMFGAALARTWNARHRTSLEYAAEELAIEEGQETVSFVGVAHAIRMGELGQLDLGLNWGVTDAAPDGKVAIGFSRRFR